MISCTSKSSVYLRWKYQQRVLSPSWHIYSYCSCTWSSRLSCKMSNSSLDPPSLVWWYALIWWVCVFFHSKKTLLFAQALFFRTRAHHLCRLVYQNLQYPSMFPQIWLLYLGVFHADISRFQWNKKIRTSTWLGKTHRSVATFCIPATLYAVER